MQVKVCLMNAYLCLIKERVLQYHHDEMFVLLANFYIYLYLYLLGILPGTAELIYFCGSKVPDLLFWKRNDMLVFRLVQD